MPTHWQVAALVQLGSPAVQEPQMTSGTSPLAFQLAGVEFPEGAADVSFNTCWWLKCVGWGFHSGGSGYFPGDGVTFLSPQPGTEVR